MGEKLRDYLLHLVTPRHTNNHRARLIHPSVISTYISLLLVFQIGLSLLVRFNPAILGYATNINATDLLTYTNLERAKKGLPLLTVNGELVAAAVAKANDMFANQYWAHTSPQGRTPWYFILNTGYNYLYAGENLARDFADSPAVVAAWMNSPSHRENLLNPRYQEIGFAVVNGKYGNYETTLVVQMFGTRQRSTPTVVAPVEAAPEPQAPPASAAAVLTTQTSPPSEPAPSPTPGPDVKVDAFTLTKNISLALTVGLMGIFALDAFLVYRRRTVRLSGHSLAHMMILVVLLIILSLVGRGVIL